MSLTDSNISMVPPRVRARVNKEQQPRKINLNEMQLVNDDDPTDELPRNWIISNCHDLIVH